MTPHRTRAQERADALDVSPTKLLADIEQLKADGETAKGQAEEYLGLLQRERAEFANYRRRTAEERERELGLAGEDLIRKVLALADDFDLASEAVPKEIASNPWAAGVVAIDRKLRALLESEGVTQIDASPGRPFDPREHEAIAHVPRSSRRSVAATGCATGSSGPRSSPSPRAAGPTPAVTSPRRNPNPEPTQPTSATIDRSQSSNGQDHRH
jgi:molecular chaperone GrpE (heat shock protein)